MKIGYARVSTGEQNAELQIDALKKAGCEKIYTDKICGARTDRPKLNEACSVFGISKPTFYRYLENEL